MSLRHSMLLPWNDKELIKKEYSKKHNSLFNVFEAFYVTPLE
jgi:hypothetical protein